MTNYEQVRNVNKPAAATQKQQQPTRRTDPGLTRQQHPAAIIQRATAAPESLTTADVLQLQRTIGNRAVGQLLSGIGAGRRESADHGSMIQAKLTINPPGDVYEQEADRVAGQVVDRINQPASQPVRPGQAVQRQEVPEEEELLQGKMIQRQPEVEEEELLQGKMIDTIQRQELEDEEELQMMPIVQRKPSGGIAAAPDLEAAIQRARGSGQPLSRGIRAPMEQAFGADFGGVRVHTGAESDTLNRSIQARAFTTGQDVFFRQGAYDPGSRGGQELLAHELTHVVQQIRGQVHKASVQSARRAQSTDGRFEAAFNALEDDKVKAEANITWKPPTYTNHAGTFPTHDDRVKTQAVSWPAATYNSSNDTAGSEMVETPFRVGYTAIDDTANNAWKIGVSSISGGGTITVHTGGSRNAITNPPTTEAEARGAVDVMKGYYARGSRDNWHTEAASKNHEKYHYREWRETCDHYWPTCRTAIETLTASKNVQPNRGLAVADLIRQADIKVRNFDDIAWKYWFTLGDSAGHRPYAAGQLTLNSAIRSVQRLAGTNGWVVELGTDSPNTANPCYKAWLDYDNP